MCGITGVISRFDLPLRFRDALPAMRETLAHRGPDSSGTARSETGELHIRRLSIIDLERGDQPFTSPDGRISIVCNGEIYNSAELRQDPAASRFPFRSRSDVESILPLYLAYGDRCVRMIDGMFALAIWDTREHRLLLARDRSGEKPLYYTDVGGELAFASELKALLRYPSVDRGLDATAVATYFMLGYVLAPRTIYRGIRSLPPGHLLVANTAGVRLESYWRARDFVPKFPASQGEPGDAAGDVRSKLRKAVARKTVADVPIGVFLSGGLDSTLLTALASEHLGPGEIHTYSAAFEERSYDESSQAALSAKHFGTLHRAVSCGERDLHRALDVVTERLDEPLGDPAILPTYLLAEAAHRDVKVILSGEGADELFGGYPTYLGHRAASWFNVLPSWSQKAARRVAGALPASSGKVTFEYLFKRFVSHAVLPGVARHFEWFGAFGPAGAARVVGPAAAAGYAEAQAELDAIGAACLEGRDLLDGILLLDYLTYLPNNLLAKVDRATMMASVEARAPFLNREVVELALALPSALKVGRFTTKNVLKDAARPILGGAQLNRRKRGLSVPIAAWINEGLRGEVDRLLERGRLKAQGWLRPEGIHTLLAEHRSGAVNHARRLWPAIMFQRWLERLEQP
jgi:asparagine synthase (glutamine-hydrolysing)